MNPAVNNARQYEAQHLLQVYGQLSIEPDSAEGVYLNCGDRKIMDLYGGHAVAAPEPSENRLPVTHYSGSTGHQYQSRWHVQCPRRKYGSSTLGYISNQDQRTGAVSHIEEHIGCTGQRASGGKHVNSTDA